MAPSPRQSTAQGPAQGCFWTTGHSWETAPRLEKPKEVACSCQDGKSWDNFGCELWMCKLPRGGGGWLRDCSEGSWAPPERTLPKTMGGRPTEELR